MIGLDTSVVVRLLIGEPAQQADKARSFVNERYGKGETPPVVSDLVVGESYFALIHHYEVPHRQAVDALLRLMRDPRIQPSGTAQSVLLAAQAAGPTPGLMDRLIQADYEHNDEASMITFDRAAGRLPATRLL